MYNLLVQLVTRYSKGIMYPITILIGFVGYKIESFVSDRYTPPLKSVPEQRNERLSNEENEFQSLKEHKFVPKTIFEKNLPPSLKDPDPREKNPLRDVQNVDINTESSAWYTNVYTRK